MTTVTVGTPTASVYINGQPRSASSGDWIDSIDPATAKPFAKVARCTADDVDAAVAAARAAQPGWDAIRPHARGRVLLRLADLINENQHTLAELEAQDAGKPLTEQSTGSSVVLKIADYTWTDPARPIDGELLQQARHASRADIRSRKR